MISRYEDRRISEVWSDQFKFQTFLQVEIALLKALEGDRIIPKGTSNKFKNVKIKPERIKEIEERTRHDVIAFCESITEQVLKEDGKFFHFGVTSSDIIDTALSIQIRESLRIILAQIGELEKALLRKIRETKNLISLGRSHGMAAEPVIFAQRFLMALVELRNRKREYEEFLKNRLSGMISGAVGNYTLITPKVEFKALKILGLSPEPITTQVIPRERISEVVQIGALLAASLEKWAVEIRHLSRTEVGEVSEGFSKGQKGSSTMPHKKNPISSENISGIARVIRSHLQVAYENVVLWHERDISHSSAERLILPDHFGLLSYALGRMASTLNNLEIHEDRIKQNLSKEFRVYSSYLLHQLILEGYESREDLYARIQKASFEARGLDDFLERVISGSIFKNARKTKQFKKEVIKKLERRYREQFGYLLRSRARIR